METTNQESAPIDHVLLPTNVLTLGWYLLARAAQRGRREGWCPLVEVGHRILDLTDEYIALERSGIASRYNDVGERWLIVDVRKLYEQLERLTPLDLVDVTRRGMQMVYEDARERV